MTYEQFNKTQVAQMIATDIRARARKTGRPITLLFIDEARSDFLNRYNYGRGGFRVGEPATRTIITALRKAFREIDGVELGKLG
jgi:hypothetical protein